MFRKSVLFIGIVASLLIAGGCVGTRKDALHSSRFYVNGAAVALIGDKALVAGNAGYAQTSVDRDLVYGRGDYRQPYGYRGALGQVVGPMAGYGYGYSQRTGWDPNQYQVTVQCTNRNDFPVRLVLVGQITRTLVVPPAGSDGCGYAETEVPTGTYDYRWEDVRTGKKIDPWSDSQRTISGNDAAYAHGFYQMNPPGFPGHTALADQGYCN